MHRTSSPARETAIEKASKDLQPWRGYLETRSGFDFLQGIGVNLHVPADREQLAIRLLAETGFSDKTLG